MANRIYRVAPAETPKAFRARLLDFVEQPLVTLPLGIIGGIMGTLFYAPILFLCGICILFGFHRAGVVKGRKFAVQIPSYLLLGVLSMSVLYGIHLVIQRGLRNANISIAELVTRKLDEWWKLRPSETHATNDSATAQPTVGGAKKSDDVKRPSALPLPSSYIQTFDAGTCESSQKPHTDQGYGLFSGLEVVLRQCEYTSDGQRAVIRFPSLNWSAVHVAGLVPKTSKGKLMELSLGWLVEWSDVDAMNHSIEWDIYSSCEDGELRLLSKASLNILQPPSVVENTAIGSLPSCKAGERYVIRIARDGHADQTQSIASLLRAQVDFR